MGALRDKMVMDMRLRGRSPLTERQYTLRVKTLAAHFMRSPAELSSVEVRTRFRGPSTRFARSGFLDGFPVGPERSAAKSKGADDKKFQSLLDLLYRTNWVVPSASLRTKPPLRLRSGQPRGGL